MDLSLNLNTATSDFVSHTDMPQSTAADYSLSQSTLIFSNSDHSASRALSYLKDVLSDSYYSAPVSSVALTQAFDLASVVSNVDITMDSTFTLNTWFVPSSSASVLPIPLTQSLRSPIHKILTDILQPSTRSTVGNSISDVTNKVPEQISHSIVSDKVLASSGKSHSLIVVILV